jgi:hypothetical protein
MKSILVLLSFLVAHAGFCDNYRYNGVGCSNGGKINREVIRYYRDDLQGFANYKVKIEGNKLIREIRSRCELNKDLYLLTGKESEIKAIWQKNLVSKSLDQCQDQSGTSETTLTVLLADNGDIQVIDPAMSDLDYLCTHKKEKETKGYLIFSLH